MVLELIWNRRLEMASASSLEQVGMTDKMKHGRLLKLIAQLMPELPFKENDGKEKEIMPDWQQL